MFGIWIIISMAQIIPETTGDFLERYALALRIMKSDRIVAVIFETRNYGLRDHIQYAFDATIQGIASALIDHSPHSTSELLSELCLYL
jgi:hypothetical protein